MNQNEYSTMDEHKETLSELRDLIVSESLTYDNLVFEFWDSDEKNPDVKVTGGSLSDIFRSVRTAHNLEVHADDNEQSFCFKTYSRPKQYELCQEIYSIVDEQEEKE